MIPPPDFDCRRQSRSFLSGNVPVREGARPFGLKSGGGMRTTRVHVLILIVALGLALPGGVALASCCHETFETHVALTATCYCPANACVTEQDDCLTQLRTRHDFITQEASRLSKGSVNALAALHRLITTQLAYARSPAPSSQGDPALSHPAVSLPLRL